MKQVYFLIAAMFVGTIANAQVKMPVQAAKDAQGQASTQKLQRKLQEPSFGKTTVMLTAVVTGHLVMEH